MNELIELGKLNGIRHPDSIILRWTYDLQVLYVILRCGIPDREDIDVPCPRPVIGIVQQMAFCQKHDMSDSRQVLFVNPDMARIYKHLRCAIPVHYDDCPLTVIGTYKDVAFCKAHAWYAHERRITYPWQVN